MDITKDAGAVTDGADLLRDHLGNPDPVTITDETLSHCWNSAIDATQGWIKPGFDADAPEGVQDFVLNVAAHIYRVRDTGGDIQALPDGTWSANASVTRNLVRRYAVLGGVYVRTPRTVA